MKKCDCCLCRKAWVIKETSLLPLNWIEKKLRSHSVWKNSGELRAILKDTKSIEINEWKVFFGRVKERTFFNWRSKEKMFTSSIVALESSSDDSFFLLQKAKTSTLWSVKVDGTSRNRRIESKKNWWLKWEPYWKICKA